MIPPVSEEQLRAWTASFLDTTSNLFATIDGVAVPNVTSLRQKSPLYALILPQNNVFQPLSIRIS